MRVLIAEDDRDMRQLLSAAVSARGHEVSDYANGAELLADLSPDRPPELVISDVQMPGLDGLSLLVRLRDTHPDLPVLLITAFGTRQLHERANELGAAAMLDKPVRLLSLLRAVDSLCA
jgi:CheY-like chemotaxis protein